MSKGWYTIGLGDYRRLLIHEAGQLEATARDLRSHGGDEDARLFDEQAQRRRERADELVGEDSRATIRIRREQMPEPFLQCAVADD